MEPFTPPTSATRGAPWYLVIILLVLALCATVTAIWFGLRQPTAPDTTPTGFIQEEPGVVDDRAEEELETEPIVSETTLPGLGELSATGLDIVYDIDPQTGQGYQTPMRKLVQEMFEQAQTCETSSAPSYGQPFTVAGVATNDYVPRINDTLFTEKIVKVANNISGSQIQICKLGTTVYALVSNWEGYGFPFAWDGNEFTRYQPLGDVMEDAYFMNDLLPGQVVIGTAFGDAGTVLWTYFILDSASRATDLVEMCRDTLAMDASGNTIVGKRHIQCERVWNL
ncbi:TPA: hypothetical protein DEB00_02700 [Candidatus Uhrbacteria bacterium]|nr:hypothetical protein [Candidatus Uhrbacteria bacterium]